MLREAEKKRASERMWTDTEMYTHTHTHNKNLDNENVARWHLPKCKTFTQKSQPITSNESFCANKWAFCFCLGLAWLGLMLKWNEKKGKKLNGTWYDYKLLFFCNSSNSSSSTRLASRSLVLAKQLNASAYDCVRVCVPLDLRVWLWEPFKCSAMWA